MRELKRVENESNEHKLTHLLPHHEVTVCVCMCVSAHTVMDEEGGGRGDTSFVVIQCEPVFRSEFVSTGFLEADGSLKSAVTWSGGVI